MCEYCENKHYTNAMGYKIYKNMAFECGDIHILEHGSGDYWLIADNSGDEYEKTSTKIEFCPKCGRKLKGGKTDV